MNKQLQIAIGKLIGKDYFKLEFGCEVIRGTEPNEPDKVIIGQYYECERNEVFNPYNKDDTGHLIEILGSEPTLQDVLLAIEKEWNFGLSCFDGELSILLRDDSIDYDNRKDIYYNLNLSLFNQTDEVKQQLLELMS